MTTAAPTMPAMKPPAQQTAGKTAPRRQVTFGPIQPRGHSALLYGPGGGGKTSLALSAPGPVGIIDLENSMPILRPQIPDDRDIRVVSGVSNWQDLRDCLKAGGWDSIKTLVLDSITLAEQMCAAWVIRNVKHPDKKETLIERLDDYGWGRGPGFVFDEMLGLLADLETHVRAGRNVILVAHDCTCECPNPAGPNYLRYEPRLQSPASGKNSIRLKIREWCDHVLLLGFDVTVTGGKGEGSGTRTLYPTELAYCMAKSRTCDTAMAVTRNDPSIWKNIIR